MRCRRACWLAGLLALVVSVVAQSDATPPADQNQASADKTTPQDKTASAAATPISPAATFSDADQAAKTAAPADQAAKTAAPADQAAKTAPAQTATPAAGVADPNTPAEKPSTSDKKPTEPVTNDKTIHLTSDIVNRVGNGDNMPYPGMDYLGIGYDIVKGNPEGDEMTKIDPGFRPPVVALNWCQDSDCLTRDVVHLTPTEGWTMPETSCNQCQSASTQTTMEDYQEALAASASVGGGYGAPGAQVQGEVSGGAESFKQTVCEKEQERYEMTSFCLKYKAGFKKGHRNVTNIQPDKYFHARVLQLPKLKKNACPPGDAGCVDMYNVGLKMFLSVECKNTKASPSEEEAKDTVVTSPTPKLKNKEAANSASDSTPNLQCDGEGGGYGLVFVKNSSIATKWVWTAGVHAGTSTLQHADTNMMLGIDPVTGDVKLIRQGGTEYQWSRDMTGGTFSSVYLPKSETDLPKSKTDAKKKDSASNFLETGKRKAGEKPEKKKKIKPKTVFLMAKPDAEDLKHSIHANVKQLGKMDEKKNNQKWTFRRVSSKMAEPWMKLFQDFGTHYIETLHLGGRMSHLLTIDSESKREIEQAGVSMKASVEAEYATVQASVSGSAANSEEAQAAFSSAKKETKTIVLGGLPPPSGADSPAGFGEWAASVADHPMPVKYSLAPLYIADASMDQNSYLRMRAYYVAGLLRAKVVDSSLKKAGQTDGAPPFTLKVGESISSGEDHKPVQDSKFNSLILHPDCNLEIKNKAGRSLWQSMSWKMGGEQGTCKLVFEVSGSLVIYHNDDKVWHSNTDSNGACAGKLAGKAVFKDGQLSIRDEGKDQETWTTGTFAKGIKGSNARIAPKEYWGDGNNICLLKAPAQKDVKIATCVRLFTDYDWKDTDAKGGEWLPGQYANTAEMKNVFNGNTYSMRVHAGVCWVEQWDNDNFDGPHVWFLKDTPTPYGPGDYDGVAIEESSEVSSLAGCTNGNKYPKQTMNSLCCSGAGGNSMKIHSTSDWQMYELYLDNENRIDVGTCNNNIDLSLGGNKEAGVIHERKKKALLDGLA